MSKHYLLQIFQNYVSCGAVGVSQFENTDDMQTGHMGQRALFIDNECILHLSTNMQVWFAKQMINYQKFLECYESKNISKKSILSPNETHVSFWFLLLSLLWLFYDKILKYLTFL